MLQRNISLDIMLQCTYITIIELNNEPLESQNDEVL
jgi:hypothetical protein